MFPTLILRLKQIGSESTSPAFVSFILLWNSSYALKTWIQNALHLKYAFATLGPQRSIFLMNGYFTNAIFFHLWLVFMNFRIHVSFKAEINVFRCGRPRPPSCTLLQGQSITGSCYKDRASLVPTIRTEHHWQLLQGQGQSITGSFYKDRVSLVAATRTENRR